LSVGGVYIATLGLLMSG